jgi:hypothetical protein
VAGKLIRHAEGVPVGPGTHLIKGHKIEGE